VFSCFLGTKSGSSFKGFWNLVPSFFQNIFGLGQIKGKKDLDFRGYTFGFYVGFLRIQIFSIKPFLVSWFPQQRD